MSTVPHQTLRSVLRGGLRVRCGAAERARCTVTATITAADARRYGIKVLRGRRTVGLGSAVATVGPGATRTLTIKVPKSVAQRVRKARRLRVTVRALALDDAGNAASATRTLTLR